jgi:trehalose 6-phosphate synthase/phosphatase
MKDSERSDRMRKNLEFSMRLTTSNWATHVLSDLKAVEKNSDRGASIKVGFGMQYKVMDLKAGSQVLDVKAVCAAYKNASSRLILLDWGGTLVESTKGDKLQSYAMVQGHTTRGGPSAELKTTLEALCLDPQNIVFVVSGKELPAMDAFFGNFRALGLAAEHGFYYRWPRNDVGFEVSTETGKPSWKSIMSVADEAWKESARKIMSIFMQRTHGTYIEEKGHALIWQFSDADPEFGFLQSKELEEHLVMIMQGYNVDVIRGGGVGDGYIEVRPAGLSKGLFLEHAVLLLSQMHKPPDFILAVGDDSSDEPMFQRLSRMKDQFLGNKVQKKSIQFGSRQSQAGAASSLFSVAVGKKPTAACAYVDDVAAVHEFLVTLGKLSHRQNLRYQSSMDLSQHQRNTSVSAVRGVTFGVGQSAQPQVSSVVPSTALGGGGAISLAMNRSMSTGNLASPPPVAKSVEVSTNNTYNCMGVLCINNT